MGPSHVPEPLRHRVPRCCSVSCVFMLVAVHAFISVHKKAILQLVLMQLKLRFPLSPFFCSPFPMNDHEDCTPLGRAGLQ